MAMFYLSGAKYTSKMASPHAEAAIDNWLDKKK